MALHTIAGEKPVRGMNADCSLQKPFRSLTLSRGVLPVSALFMNRVNEKSRRLFNTGDSSAEPWSGTSVPMVSSEKTFRELPAACPGH